MIKYYRTAEGYCDTLYPKSCESNLKQDVYKLSEPDDKTMWEFLNWFETAKPGESFVIKGEKATTTVEVKYESDPKIYCSICGSEFSEHKSEGLLISSETFKIKKYDSDSESWKEEPFFVCPNCKNSITSFFKRRRKK